MTTVKQYDKLNRLTSITSTPTGTNQAAESVRYPYNAANQRVRAELAGGQYWEYAYDQLGQVVSARKRWQDGSPVPGQQFEYAYDDIGNRTSASEHGSAYQPASYTANALNQYTQREVPGVADIIGVANPNTNVTVNSQAAYRRGEYYHKAISASNSSNAAFPMVSVQAGSTNSPDGRVYIAKTPEVFHYDADGNLTNDGRWNYTWNAENRLVKVESAVGTPVGAWNKLEFEYDWQGRRISKKVYQPAYKNLVSPANGGSLLAHPPEYDDWPSSRITDGNRGGWYYAWSSVGVPQTAQEFIYQFTNATAATLGEVILANYGLNELGYNCYSKNFSVYVSTTDTNTWTLALSGVLEARLGPQWFALTNVSAKYVKLSITSNYDPASYWTLSEFEVYGAFDIPETPTEEVRFLYDGWNLIAELDAQLSLVKSHAWGLDLSGTLQGAGGVGGLLLTIHSSPSTASFPAYDGNGNVTAYIDASTGDKNVVYEYGPFGQLLRATGPMAGEFNFLFSTKYYDWETRLIYYGHRYLGDGRWISKDPIEEAGGVNLYGFVGNDSLNRIDPLGEEIQIVAGRYDYNFVFESVQSNWGLERFANRIRRAFQEIIGDCAKLKIEEERNNDAFVVNTARGSKQIMRKRYKLTFSDEKPSCACNDCWQLLKSAIIGNTPVIQLYYINVNTNAYGITQGSPRSVYINPGVDVKLPEESKKGGYRNERAPFSIVLWHEAIGHGQQGYEHSTNAINHASTWDGRYVDPTIGEENNARKCTRLLHKRYGGLWGLFGRSLGDRRPTYHGD